MLRMLLQRQGTLYKNSMSTKNGNYPCFGDHQCCSHRIKFNINSEVERSGTLSKTVFSSLINVNVLF